MPTFAVCVVTIGDEYVKFYEKYFKKSHERYCNKYGYDLINITTYIDPNLERHTPDYISFQKILVANYPPIQKYDYVVVLDADIYALRNTPPLTEITDRCGDKVGAVNESCDPSYPIREAVNRYKEWPVTATDYYKSILPQYSFETNMLINTGFFLIQPKIHGKFFQGIYDKYAEAQKNHPKEFQHENACIGYELQVQNMLYPCDNRWNCIVCIHAWNPFQNLQDPEFFFNVFLQKYSFLHFCGKWWLDYAEFLEKNNL